MSDYHLNGWSPELDRQDELKRRSTMGRINQRWHRIEVTGKGMFPIDMLRHDQCFPIFESDSMIIRNNLPHNEAVIALGHWGPSSWVPTAERWKSYGWTVTHHEVMR